MFSTDILFCQDLMDIVIYHKIHILSFVSSVINSNSKSDHVQYCSIFKQIRSISVRWFNACVFLVFHFKIKVFKESLISRLQTVVRSRAGSLWVETAYSANQDNRTIFLQIFRHKMIGEDN